LVSKLKNFYKFIEQNPDMWTQIKHRTDKKEAVTIGFFSIIGVIITIIIIGIGVTSVFHVPFVDALLFGAILAATHRVAVGRCHIQKISDSIQT
jgi:NhaP-type Na+/H+ or K+/H+ antiporter